MTICPQPHRLRHFMLSQIRRPFIMKCKHPETKSNSNSLFFSFFRKPQNILIDDADSYEILGAPSITHHQYLSLPPSLHSFFCLLRTLFTNEPISQIYLITRMTDIYIQKTHRIQKCSTPLLFLALVCVVRSRYSAQGTTRTMHRYASDTIFLFVV